LRPVTRKPPSTGSAFVCTPEVAPAEMPSLNGWLWITPSSTTPRNSSARRRWCSARSSAEKSSMSATWPAQSIVALCMLKVSAVAPQ
jgi:hypothetical protein